MSGHVKTSQGPQKHLRPQRVKQYAIFAFTDTNVILYRNKNKAQE